MKNIFFALILFAVILFSGIAAITGASIMVYNLYSSGPNIMTGFTIFCLGSILFLATIIAYSLSKLITNNELLTDTMIKFVEHEIDKVQGPNAFGPNGGMHFPFETRTITFNTDPTNLEAGSGSGSTENFTGKNLMDVFFGGMKPPIEKKKLEDMTIEELNIEKNIAVGSQDYSKAARIRDLIQKKEKGE